MDLLNMIKQALDFSPPLLEQVPFLRESLGFLLVFFIPGFAWTLIFFRRVPVIERVVLYSGLSIALVTLVVCGLNLLFGVKIDGLNMVLAILAITAIPLVIFGILKLLRVGRDSSDTLSS
ncbi:MAG: DUF1616 domain-containing protein [Chloroflexota bacterium]|nr:MAG: DUF1616 domain-containing protein [Chloroflexota bacterium]